MRRTNKEIRSLCHREVREGIQCPLTASFEGNAELVAMTTESSQHPISGICIITDPTKCPPNYECIYVSKDRNEDCDLWKDSFFKMRVTRYLCFTREYTPVSGTASVVLADIVLNNERDPPPPGFTLLDLTLDTREKATRKKQICIKVMPRHTTNDAISDLIILSRNKRAPPEYTLVGEINGLLICFKMDPVPPEMQITPEIQTASTTVPPSPAYSYNNSFNPGQATHWPAAPTSATPPYHPWSNNMPSPSSFGAGNHHRQITKQDSLIHPISALVGVPFQFNARFKDMDQLRNFSAPDVHFRSLVDIENEYSYKFAEERACGWNMNSRKKRFTLIRKGNQEPREGSAENEYELVGSGIAENEEEAPQPEVSDGDGVYEEAATVVMASGAAQSRGPSCYSGTTPKEAKPAPGRDVEDQEEGLYDDVLPAQFPEKSVDTAEEDEEPYYNLINLPKRVSVPNVTSKEQKDPRFSKKCSLPELYTSPKASQDPDYYTTWEATSGGTVCKETPPSGILPPHDNRSSIKYASQLGVENDYDKIKVPAPSQAKAQASLSGQAKQEKYKHTLIPPPPPTTKKRMGRGLTALAQNFESTDSTFDDPNYRGFDLGL